MGNYLFSRRHLLATIVAAAGFVGASGTPAQAALLGSSSCSNQTLTQPFLRWGDTNTYELAPGGSFEGPPTWTLSGGARVVAGSEPFGVTGSVGSSSLYLPAGGSAQSPFVCVSTAKPTFRFFGVNRSLLSTVLVQIVYNEPLLGQVAVPVGVVALSGKWAPSLPMLTGSGILDLSSGTAQVALRFTTLTGGSQIDDVFVDPRMHD